MSTHTQDHAFKIDDRVSWIEPARNAIKNAIKFGPLPAAQVRKIGHKQIQIEVRFKPAYGPGNSWESEFKWVDPTHLKPRVTPSQAFNEPMVIESHGFTITPLKHSVGNGYINFKSGIFYGLVDGFSCTGPCSSPEAAIANGLHALTEGGYRIHLLSQIKLRMSWITQKVLNPEKLAQAETELVDLHSRLAKLYTAMPEQRHPTNELAQENAVQERLEQQAEIAVQRYC